MATGAATDKADLYPSLEVEAEGVEVIGAVVWYCRDLK